MKVLKRNAVMQGQPQRLRIALQKRKPGDAGLSILEGTSMLLPVAAEGLGRRVAKGKT